VIRAIHYKKLKKGIFVLIRMKIKYLPNVLAVHLKRFKFQEQLGRFSKLTNRVCFTEQLRLFNTADEASDSERLYDLSAIIVHIGSGPHHGHYVAVIRNRDQWLCFDDEDVIVFYFNLGSG
jgi:ubiquitin C-terminal hydrolase